MKHMQKVFEYMQAFAEACTYADIPFMASIVSETATVRLVMNAPSHSAEVTRLIADLCALEASGTDLGREACAHLRRLLLGTLAS